jgi:peroxiredoxin
MVKKTYFYAPWPALAVAAVALLAACSDSGADRQQTDTRVDPGEFRTGRWAASVTVPGGEIRFDVDLARAQPGVGYSATLINGEERIAVGEVMSEGKSLRLSFPAFNSRVDAALDGGVLEGNLTLGKRGGVEQTMPFRAEYAQGYTFSIGGTEPAIDVTGRWDVTFVQDDGKTSKAVGEFRQDGASVYGTFLTPTGDYRYLAGDAAGRSFELSCFDGSHAFLFKAKLSGQSTLDGDFWSGTKWHERWTATRDDDVTLPDPYELTYLKDGYDRIEFSFPGLDGRSVSLDHSRFRGKVVIVALEGSWCPNCHDEAAFLSQYYKENKHRGVEIVTLMYEHLRDEGAAMRQIERFKKKHDIDYELLYAGYSDKAEAQKTLPMLDHVMSYPTMILIDRTGKVRRIHTGFAGPGTGRHYEAFVEKFSGFVDELLAE